MTARKTPSGLLVRARMAQFSDWWNDEHAWQGEPMGPVFDWIAES